MSKKKTTWAFLILAVLPSLLALTACNPLEDDSKSSTFIVVESMQGKDETGKAASFLDSDVITSDGIIYADTADRDGPGQLPGPRARPQALRVQRHRPGPLRRLLFPDRREEPRRASTSPIPSRAR